MSRNWLAVASANHVRKGRAEGFMQVCHGKLAPLRRIKPGDLVVLAGFGAGLTWGAVVLRW